MKEENISLVKYAKHVPRLLRQQILCELLKKYLPSSIDTSAAGHDYGLLPSVGPSIQRFHGALLFVDISGFTALSQKLEIEALKNHINSYFSKMLDIVEKWEGDVVKFAGDALYIVWPTSLTPSAEDSAPIPENSYHGTAFALAAKKGVEKAVACGLQIAAVCGNYEVKLTATTSTEHAATGMLSRLMSFGGLMTGKVVPTNTEASEDIVYLNVHSGVSCGLMAGVDIVHSNRAEFFLVGDPLTGVAMAESQASKGDVVLDTSAHELMHGENAGQAVKGHLGMNLLGTKKDSSRNDRTLLCGCCRTDNGMFLASKLLAGGTKYTRVKPVQRASITRQFSSKASNTDITEIQTAKLSEDIDSDLNNLFISATGSFRKAFYQYFRILRDQASVSSDFRLDETKFFTFLMDVLKKHFMEWMGSTLFGGVTQHVHEVARTLVGTAVLELKRMPSFHELLRSSAATISSNLNDAISPSSSQGGAHYRNSVTSIMSNTSETVAYDEEEDELEHSISSTERQKRTPTNISSHEGNNGELRTVIVMFIKIERFDLRLKIDTKGKAISFSYNRFSFLDRTPNEQQADNFLLNRFQACYEVLCSALMNNGGQLRQFIVDDKGTVCIGTFGLRGSAAVDNAAAALEAARQIMEGLAHHELTASIGITSGKAYCGLVGSFMRHEYAVMGPSTNLSARLMCKAPPHGAICDADTVSRDRTHKFAFVSEVQAKGYTKPVMTYNPVFIDEDDDIEDSMCKLVKQPSNGHMMKNRVISNASLQVVAQEVKDVVTTTNFANKRKLSTQQKMLALVKTDFFICEATARFDSAGNQKTSMSQKLHGRDEEITEILTFLFKDDADNPQLINTNGKTKMITVCGSSGAGKTALLNAVERKLQNVVRTDHTCNMVILRNRTTSLQHDLPFRSWQVVLHKLLLTVHNRAKSSVISSTKLSSTRSAQSDSSSLSRFSNFGEVIDLIWPQLPEEFQNKRDLLGVLSLAQNNEQWHSAKEEDKSEERLEACSSLIAALFTALSSAAESIMLLLFTDVHTFDRWSLITLWKVWATSRGVSIVTTYNNSESNGSNNWNEGGLTIKIDRSLDVDDGTARFFNLFNDLNTFKILTLQPLDKEATKAMVMGVCGEVGQQELEKIFDISTGRPLYIAELIESFSKASSVEEKLNCLVKVDAYAMAEVIPSSKISHRIEEVICYRLDKLPLACQVALKATAVAVSYGRSCTYDLLKYMLCDDLLFVEDPEGVLTALLELARTEDFLKRRSGSGSMHSVNAEELSVMEFEFNIPLEQTTIYALLVDEQKEIFHERTASYFELNCKSTDHETELRDLWENGFHWDHAGYWSRSMRAYLLAAKKCKAEGNSLRCTESLLMAYQIYQNMEQEVAIIALPEQCYGFADQIARCLFMPSMENMNELETSADLILALKTAQEVFEPDPASIVDAIELHIMLAEIYLYKWEDFQEIMRILSVGVLLGAASVWKPVAGQEPILFSLGSGSSSSKKRRGSNHQFSQLKVCIMPLKRMTKNDYVHLFSLCAFVSRLVGHGKGITFSFEQYKAKLLPAVDEVCSPTSTNAINVIHTQSMIAIRCLQLGKISRAATALNDVLKTYDPAKHSSALAARYSADFVPYALALLSQALIAGKDAKTGMDYWQKALTCLQSVSHDYSLTIALMALMSSVHFLGEYNAIAKLLEKSQELVQQGYNTMGSQMCKLMQLWVEVGIISSPENASAAQSLKSNAGKSMIDAFLSICTSLDHTANGNLQETAVATTIASQEVSVGRLTFMELHGCAVERIYVEIMCGLWHVANEGHLYVLEQRIQNSLQILLQCPVHDFMSVISKGYNMLHSLTHVLLTGKSANGLSAGAIYTAVTERAEQPLLMLLKLLQQKDCPHISWLLAACIRSLPLHEGIREAHAQQLKEARSRLESVCLDEQAEALLLKLANRVGVAASAIF